MTVPSDGWYWAYLSDWRKLRTLAGVVPCYVVQLTRRPYRRGLPRVTHESLSDRFKGRHAAAALDLWVAQFLRAYPSVTGYRAGRTSGELAICYMRLLAVFNREYEYRLATGKSLDLQEICESPLVTPRMTEWRQFASRHTSDTAIIEFMSNDDVAADYAAYVAVTTRPGFDTDPGLQIESIRLDSGGYLTHLARLIDRLNGNRSDPAALADFFALGIASKLADELADLAADYAEGRYNLLLALLAQHPTELSTVAWRLEHALPIPVSQWQQSAPEAFREYCRIFERHYQSLRSGELRRLCDLTMLRAARGPLPIRRAGNRHVTERPAQPLR